MGREPLKHPLPVGTKLIDHAWSRPVVYTILETAVRARYAVTWGTNIGPKGSLSISQIDEWLATSAALEIQYPAAALQYRTCEDGQPNHADLENAVRDPSSIEQLKLCAFADKAIVHSEPYSTVVSNGDDAKRRARLIVASRYREWPTCGGVTLKLQTDSRHWATSLEFYLLCLSCHDKKHGGAK